MKSMKRLNVLYSFSVMTQVALSNDRVSLAMANVLTVLRNHFKVHVLYLSISVFLFSATLYFLNMYCKLMNCIV